MISISLIVVAASVQIARGSYYLGSDVSSYAEATAFCQQTCNSDLASANSIADKNQMEFTLLSRDFPSNSPVAGAWIGMWSDGQSYDSWQDGTQIMFADPDGLAGRYVWADNANFSAGGCAYIPFGGQNRWQMGDCEALKLHAICNSCDGVIRKTALASMTPQTPTQAENLCSDTFGTGVHAETNETRDEIDDIFSLYNLTEAPSGLQYALCDLESELSLNDWFTVRGSVNVNADNGTFELFHDGGGETEMAAFEVQYFNNLTSHRFQLKFTLDKLHTVGLKLYNGPESTMCFYYLLRVVPNDKIELRRGFKDKEKTIAKAKWQVYDDPEFSSNPHFEMKENSSYTLNMRVADDNHFYFEFEGLEGVFDDLQEIGAFGSMNPAYSGFVGILVEGDETGTVTADELWISGGIRDWNSTFVEKAERQVTNPDFCFQNRTDGYIIKPPVKNKKRFMWPPCEFPDFEDNQYLCDPEFLKATVHNGSEATVHISLIVTGCVLASALIIFLCYRYGAGARKTVKAKVAALQEKSAKKTVLTEMGQAVDRNQPADATSTRASVMANKKLDFQDNYSAHNEDGSEERRTDFNTTANAATSADCPPVMKMMAAVPSHSQADIPATLATTGDLESPMPALEEDGDDVPTLDVQASQEVEDEVVVEQVIQNQNVV